MSKRVLITSSRGEAALRHDFDRGSDQRDIPLENPYAGSVSNESGIR